MDVIIRWNWDYQSALEYQESCREEVRQNPKKIVLIICSHPRCFTLGRGLQKNQKYQGSDLVDFDPLLEADLNFPVYKIKRGGGLTFHYPGQLIIYPIINLTHNKIGVYDLMIKMLEIIKVNLESTFGLNGLSLSNNLLGLWTQEETKIASIGLSTSHYVTNHGLALNFFHDDKTFSALQSLYPCGLPGRIYQSVESITKQSLPLDSRLKITKSFQREFIKFIDASINVCSYQSNL